MCRVVYKKILKNKLTRHLNIKSDSTAKEKHVFMESKIAMILEILSDGKWHVIEELQQQLEIDEYEVQEIAKFLSRYDFAMVDDANTKVRINRGFQKFLAQTMI
jgi:hypothetical protein